MSTTVIESRAFAEAAVPADGPGRLLVTLITAGKGSSGVYTPETLQAAAEARIFTAGTHMHLDHQTATENYERPVGSVTTLAAALAEDAYYDPVGERLVAEARVYSRYRTTLAEMAEDIGVSIRADADFEMGEWEGQPARIITRLTEAVSVDFVTKPGRGGRYEVLESASTAVAEARNVGQWVESRIHLDFTRTADEMFGDGRLTRDERITLSGAIGDALGVFVTRLETDAPGLYQRDIWQEPPLAADQAVESAVRHGVAEATANDRRDQLQALVKDTYGGEKVWPWVRDFDDTNVWFEIDGGDAGGTFQQAYTVTDDVADALAGDRVEVRIQTSYVPVPTTTATEAATSVPVDPAGQSTTTSQEDTMPQIEEARLRQLEEAHGRVPALESDLKTARTRAEEAEQRALQAEAGTYARDLARQLVTKANPDLAEASVRRIVRESLAKALPLEESGRLDTAAFTPTVEEARKAEETYLAQVAEASGVGTVRGVGHTSTQPVSVSESDVDEAIAAAFGRKGA